MKTEKRVSEFCREFGITVDQFYGRVKIEGSLYLSSLTSIPEGFNPTVGVSLELRRGLNANKKPLPDNFLLSWQDGKYIKADGLFTEVLSHRGNVYKVSKIHPKKEVYLITDGHGKWSHGDTLKEAKSDLIFKISNRNKSDYQHLKKDSVLSFEEAIVCYRVVTGACAFGTKDFVTTRLTDKKKTYFIAEIISLTQNEFGNKTFKEFFKK